MHFDSVFHVYVHNFQSGICPYCGSRMIRHVERGKVFWACSNCSYAEY